MTTRRQTTIVLHDHWGHQCGYLEVTETPGAPQAMPVRGSVNAAAGEMLLTSLATLTFDVVPALPRQDCTARYSPPGSGSRVFACKDELGHAHQDHRSPPGIEVCRWTDDDEGAWHETTDRANNADPAPAGDATPTAERATDQDEALHLRQNRSIAVLQDQALALSQRLDAVEDVFKTLAAKVHDLADVGAAGRLLNLEQRLFNTDLIDRLAALESRLARIVEAIGS